MPNKYTKYGCQFKCGYKLSRCKVRIEEHETVCWNNPINKTCKTCKHEDYTIDSTETSQGNTSNFYIRDCKNEDGAELLEENYDDLVNKHTIHIKPIVNCSYHSLKLKSKLLFLTNGE